MVTTREAIGWLAAGTIPNTLYRVLIFYFVLACVFCYCCFLFVVFVLFCSSFCSGSSFVDVPPIVFCPADHVPDWQPRILLSMVEARSVDVKNPTSTTYSHLVYVTVYFLLNFSYNRFDGIIAPL